MRWICEACVWSAAVWLSACGSDAGIGAGIPAGGGAGRPGGAAGGDAGAGAPGGGAGSDGGALGAGSDGGGGAPGPASCASVSAQVGLLPVHLAFAFDVSGSMGKGDEPWHDKALKWDPVVRATRAFFEQPGASGVLASLTFFPEDGGEDERCAVDAYQEPDVPMTALPSTRFGAAIAAIEPASEDDWRGGTPTLWVMRGTRDFIARARAASRGSYAIVLVTDGYPQGCDEDSDKVAAVVDEARAAAAEGVRSYVIGVANPRIEDAPDTVSDLHEIARAGQTDSAYLVDTGSPDATVQAFAAAVQSIREASASCAVAIPEPAGGQAFDRQKVAVSYRSRGAQVELGYDTSCMRARSWRYDDPEAPTQIELCPSSCDEVKADPEADLEILFACDDLILL